MLFRRSTNSIVLLIFGCLLIIDGHEETKTSRTKRGRNVRTSGSPQSAAVEPSQDLQDTGASASSSSSSSNSNNNQQDVAVIPPGFLSPSVQEYLELGKSIPGRPGTDYPILAAIPYTNFYCDEQEYPGFFADMDTRCQGWHYCDIDGRQATFLCPNGTQFSQAVFVCDWWFNVRCDLSPRLYSINARLYQRPKFNPTQPHRVITRQLVDEIFNV